MTVRTTSDAGISWIYEFPEMSLRGDTAASAVKADAVAGSYGIVR